MGKRFVLRQAKLLIVIFIIANVSFYYFLHQKNITQRNYKSERNLYLSKQLQQNKTTKPDSNHHQLSSAKYIRLHQRIVLNRSEPRVVFYKIFHVGYGNRIYNMLSGFLAAVVTESAFLINWDTINAFIESPLQNVFTGFSDLSFLDANQNSPQICTIKAWSPNTWAFSKDLNTLLNTTLPQNCTRYFMSDMTPYFFDLAANLEYAKKLVEYGFVREATVQKASQALHDPTVRISQKLEYLYLIGFEFGGHVLNNYWLLNSNMQEKIRKYSSAYFDGAFVIGFQMRFVYMDVIDIDVFVSCAQSIEASNKHRIGSRPVKWFISTDRSDLIENFSSVFQDKILVGEGKIGHVAFEDGTYERAILDIELLSRCNETILTGGSTFGFIGSIKSQKRPFLVEGKRKTTACTKLQFFAPARTPSGPSMFR